MCVFDCSFLCVFPSSCFIVCVRVFMLSSFVCCFWFYVFFCFGVRVLRVFACFALLRLCVVVYWFPYV